MRQWPHLDHSYLCVKEASEPSFNLVIIRLLLGYPPLSLSILIFGSLHPLHRLLASGN